MFFFLFEKKNQTLKLIHYVRVLRKINNNKNKHDTKCSIHDREKSFINPRSY